LTGGDPKLTFELQARAAPVLSPMGAWDSHDALNPSVVARGGQLFNFYSGYDGHVWRTALATSSDGLVWQAQGTMLAPDPKIWEGSYIAANGSVLFYANQFWYWYAAGPRNGGRIGLAQSSNGLSFRKLPAPVVSTGPFESWEERAVADPSVIRIDPYFYMYYLGQDRAIPPRQRIGVARSTDGIHWQKLIANPILDLGQPGDFDEAAVGEPAVFAYQNWYWMLYTGNRFSHERSIGLARSTDGIHWTKLPLPISGRSAWNSKVLCDPAVLVEGGAIRVWIGGGDVASLDENLHGQIGYGVLQPSGVTLAK
jgi:predicted GH43/DUF377 family glycosyl hydrolase